MAWQADGHAHNIACSLHSGSIVWHNIYSTLLELGNRKKPRIKPLSATKNYWRSTHHPPVAVHCKVTIVTGSEGSFFEGFRELLDSWSNQSQKSKPFACTSEWPLESIDAVGFCTASSSARSYSMYASAFGAWFRGKGTMKQVETWWATKFYETSQKLHPFMLCLKKAEFIMNLQKEAVTNFLQLGRGMAYITDLSLWDASENLSPVSCKGKLYTQVFMCVWLCWKCAKQIDRFHGTEEEMSKYR